MPGGPAALTRFIWEPDTHASAARAHDPAELSAVKALPPAAHDLDLVLASGHSTQREPVSAGLKPAVSQPWLVSSGRKP